MDGSGLWVLVFAIVAGGFLNSCIYRIPRKKPIVFSGFVCASCHHALEPYELIPILSYCLLRGKCKYCRGDIPFALVVVELLTGVLVLILYWRFSFGLLFVKYAVLTGLLIVVSFIDLDTMTIPNGLIVFGFSVVGIFCVLDFCVLDFAYFLNILLGFLVGGGLFLFLAVIAKGAMGGGDVKLMALIGVALGVKLTVLTILFSFVLGALVSVVLIALKIKSRKDAIPFGPFIGVGAYISAVFGSDIMDWYFYHLLSFSGMHGISSGWLCS